MTARICLFFVSAFLVPGEIIDRIAVVIERQAITESSVLLEIRLTAFLNGEDADLGAANRRKTAERMVDQALVRSEMVLSQYPMPDAATVQTLLADVKKEGFSSEEQYLENLKKHRVSEEELLEHSGKQIAMMRFIDIRFRPGIQLLETELRDYYEKRFVPEWREKNGPPAPAFDSVRGKIEQILTEEHVNQAVEKWIREARSRARIEFKEEAFQ